jgi:hypothetical protein
MRATVAAEVVIAAVAAGVVVARPARSAAQPPAYQVLRFFDGPTCVRMAKGGRGQTGLARQSAVGESCRCGRSGRSGQDVARACDACHAKYREGDQQTGYRIKSSS